jgi:uncharacterized protein (DUF1800 family)
MDRRATLNRLLGRKPILPPPEKHQQLNTAFEAYTGEWTFELAAHLLKRTTLGPTRQTIQESVALGMEQTVEQLFEEQPLPEPPLNYDNDQDPNVPIGETWIHAVNLRNTNLRPYRHRSLRAWMIGQMLQEGISIREKLTLFWHNHFAINNIQEPRYLYVYISLLRENAWGNFKQLVKDITIDPSMLRFLNGRQNSLRAPNENYARELLELFSIGKGELAGPGDYSTFTEDDVREIARALTGWVDTGYNGRDPDVPVGAQFVPARHDEGAKQLSHRFNDAVIENAGAAEYANVVDIIFQQDEVARHICRKLYRWFVFYQIDDIIESDVIEPMAQVLIANNYEIRPALIALLQSQHFHDFAMRGAMIKNPVDFTISTFKQLDFAFSEDLEQKYHTWYRIFIHMRLQQMELFNLPEVAGWKAYYQEPLFYRTWINATTFPIRMALTDQASTRGFTIRGHHLEFQALDLVNNLDNPSDINALLNDLIVLLFPMTITDDQIAALKEILIPGLPDFEWTVEYLKYQEDPEDPELKRIIDAKIRLLIQAMLSMAEFYLS